MDDLLKARAYGPAACLVLAQLLRTLKTKGILTDAEIEGLLQPAEAALLMFGEVAGEEAADVMAFIRDGAE